jgi:hypothetical protein
MRKIENDFKKELKLLKNPLIHTPELYKILGLSRGNFRDKLNETAGARFTDPQKKEITKQLKKLSKQLCGL